MKNWKGLAIVGALVLGAVLSSLPVTGQGQLPFPSHGQWRQLCKDQTEVAELCAVVTAALEGAVRDELANDSTANFIRNVLPEVKKALHLRGNASCTECVNEASQFFDLLLQNTTVQQVENMGHLACELKFTDPALAEECDEYVEVSLPQIIQHLENELPPEQVCVELKHCPAI